MESAYAPLLHLSAINSPLGAAEEGLVRERLQAMEHRVSNLTTELAILKKHILEYKRILSPIPHLPLEILSEIFTRIPPEDNDRPSNYQGVIPVISVVCKRWCDAATSTPQLWRDFSVNARHLSLEDAEGIRTWALRAGELPKSMTFYADHCAQLLEDIPTYLESLPGCLGAEGCIFRSPALREILGGPLGILQSLAVDCPSPDCFQWFGEVLASARMGLSPCAWSLMKSFTLISGNWGRWPIHPPRSLFHFLPGSITTFTLHLPRLYSFGEETGDWNIDLQIPQSILEGLTAFHLVSEFASGHLFRLLPHCAKLETLTIDFSEGPLDIWSQDPTTQHALEHGFTLPKLRILHLTNGSTFRELDRMRMPELIELSIEATQWCSLEISDPSFRAFIRGDSNLKSTLQHLAIKHIGFRDNALFDTLKDLTSLTHLTLDDVKIDNDTFQKLSQLTPCSLPQLKILKLVNFYASKFDDVLHLREFVEERSVELTFSLNPRFAV